MSADKIRLNLHPAVFPDIDEMEFAANFVPSAFGSGDIYNIFQLDNKTVGLYNIDVSGHGFSASLFSLSLKQRLNDDFQFYDLINSSQAESPSYSLPTPHEIARALDREDMLGKYGRFFTMVYALVNIEIGLVSFYRAGHNLPLVVHDCQRSEFIKGGGAPIGMGLHFGRKEDQKFMLSPGDQFILFSDGLNDAYSQGKKSRYGLSRLRQVLTDHYALPLVESFKLLIMDVKKFIGEDSFSDDVSIIGFKWLGGNTDPVSR